MNRLSRKKRVDANPCASRLVTVLFANINFRESNDVQIFVGTVPGFEIDVLTQVFFSDRDILQRFRILGT